MRNLILHLSLIDNVGPVLVQRVVQVMRSRDLDAQAIYKFSQHDWMLAGFSERQASLIAGGLRDFKMVEREQLLCEKQQISWTTVIDDAFPVSLKNLTVPPAVLYWRGAL